MEMINTVTQVSHTYNMQCTNHFPGPNTNLSLMSLTTQFIIRLLILSSPKFSLILASSFTLRALVHLHPPRVFYVTQSALMTSKDLYTWLYSNISP
jgi:hypothetical protein